jgi:hypothetical protein
MYVRGHHVVVITITIHLHCVAAAIWAGDPPDCAW